MAQKLFIPTSLVMWGISKEELEEILVVAHLSSQEKQAILDEYNQSEFSSIKIKKREN